MKKELYFDKTYSVIGIGFGDEGKGTVVDYLASENPGAVVFRHSGGHQVGHTVKIDDKLHEFRQFGSGTLRGIPTVWNRACTISPLQFEIEFNILKNNFGIIPEFYCSEHCPITTLYDIAYNRAKEKQYKCGSTGVGFAATLKRHEIVPLFAMDLQYPFVLKEKLRNINSYYFGKVNNENLMDFYTEELGELNNSDYTLNVFIQSCEFFINNAIFDTEFNPNKYDVLIYEGNQGVLLDKYHGFYPNVTYSYTTNRNVKCNTLDTFYISRCYGTRHGCGILANENLDSPILINDEFEQNHKNPWQDDFRTAILDYDMIKYAIKCDQSYQKNITSNLVVTCMDQIENPQITKSGILRDLNVNMFRHLVDSIYVNNSPESKTIKLV